MTNKMTNVKALAYVLENCEVPADVAERFTAMKASLEKKATRKPTGPSKAQIARMALAEQVFAAMESGVDYTCSDIAGLIPELAGATPQKVSPLMRMLGDRVNHTTVKGKAIYSIA